MRIWTVNFYQDIKGSLHENYEMQFFFNFFTFWLKEEIGVYFLLRLIPKGPTGALNNEFLLTDDDKFFTK